MKQPEYRSYSGQDFRANETASDGKVIIGHAAVFGQRTNVCGMFEEVIDIGAFDTTDFRDVALMVNHDWAKIPLARSRRNNANSTLRLSVDEVGLAIQAKLDVDNNADARTLYSAVERGDLDGMSFAFIVDGEEWEDLESEVPLRRIKSISRVMEVSACTYPQYSNTDIQARAASTLDSAKRALENARRQSVDTDSEIEIYRLKNQILGGINYE